MKSEEPLPSKGAVLFFREPDFPKSGKITGVKNSGSDYCKNESAFFNKLF